MLPHPFQVGLKLPFISGSKAGFSPPGLIRCNVLTFAVQGSNQRWQKVQAIAIFCIFNWTGGWSILHKCSALEMNPVFVGVLASIFMG